MPHWDPTSYLTYADERSRPFVELVGRVPRAPRTIVDLGCGPGHLSAVLRTRWPEAEILGIDSSPQMIERAVAENTDARTSYRLGDIASWAPPSPVDLVVSNAALQWVPDQLDVARRLREHVAPGGALAIQVPHNHDEPSHRLLRDVAAREPYAQHTEHVTLSRGTSATAYLEALAGPGWSIDAWETTYLHVLDGDDPVLAWISGTGARPVLQALPDELRRRFEAEYGAALRDAYPRRPFGTVLPFPRTFVVATRTAT
ncbi:Trans-aconitate 2-methyltransferase [Beutenbergia cavernae DSM 12333]|uniref:Trans-aconitate 2-methyltransferase n=1 Tax=Beutenbergia cavernae (strain ATCC BAA-8 / DSM 12333 / CCUG 43141 / JCM 11478 / NBRC 16432 / NCIMB 13614 / HKI 0122) TaxID=471853 RepID=C5C5W6_BEUC1|nr:methyltransferase domain-containing protein [Beutenbergia cavernae]ACQ82324.1 Trans-aconitate 2-methyltransferase [Beutenbergia cavernae DSM 12333]